MKARNYCLAGLIVTLFLISDALGQRKQAFDAKSVRIKKKLPTVFLKLERTITSKDAEGKQEKLVLIRLVNNSRWFVLVDASGGQKGLDEAKLYYETLDKKGSVVEQHLCHVCSIIDLKSGGSILFSVPYDEVAEADSLRVAFTYQWEDVVMIAPENEPTHYVYLYSRELKQ